MTKHKQQNKSREPKPKGRQRGAKDKKPRKVNPATRTTGKHWKRKDAHRWRQPFLKVLGKLGIVSKAAKKAGCTRAQVNDLLKKDESFRQEFDDAMQDASDVLEEAAWKRAKAYSDPLMKYLLSVHKRYKETHGLELTGEGGGPLEVEVMRAEEQRQFLVAVCSSLLGKDDDNGGQEDGEEGPGGAAGRLGREGAQGGPAGGVHATNGAAVAPPVEPPAGAAD